MKENLNGIDIHVEINGIRVSCTTFDHVLSEMGSIHNQIKKLTLNQKKIFRFPKNEK